MERRKIHYAFVILISCCVIIGGAAAITFNCAGIFLEPVSKGINTSIGKLSLYLTILYSSVALFLPFAGRLISRYNIRLLASAAVILNGITYIAMSRFTEVHQFYIAGIALGVSGTIILYLLAPSIINRWFKAKTGLFLGITMAFSGIGSIALNPVGTMIIENYGWRSGYLVFGCVLLLLVLPFAAFGLKNHPSDMGLKAYGETDSDTSIKTDGISVKEAFKMPSFYLIGVFAICIAVMSGIFNFLPSYVSFKGFSSMIGAYAASFAMAGNMSGKIILGAVNDRTVSGGLLLGVTAVLTGLFLLLFIPGSMMWIIFLGALMYGFTHSVCTVQCPLLVKNVFGNREYPRIYANIMVVSALGSAIGGFFGFVVTHKGYNTMFIAGIILGIITLTAGTTALIKEGKLTNPFVKIKS